jgi:hypothetical protein
MIMRKNKNRTNKTKYFRKYKGGTSFEQKGVAAQLRSSAPHNSELRRKLNEIVHSGDFYESKERNGFLNLNNDYDEEAQSVLNDAVDYIQNKKELTSKIKRRVLQGIAPVVSTPSRTTVYHKTSTKRMRTRTPTKNNTITSTMTHAMNSTQRRSRKQRRTRRRLRI